MAYWGANAAQEALNAVYQRILGRSIDATGLETWGRRLVMENVPLRDVVRGLGFSQEYNERYVMPYIQSQNIAGVVAEAYQRFLGRPPESQAVVMTHAQKIIPNGQYDPEGYKRLVGALVDSQEYMRNWGEQGIPGVGQHPNPQM